MPATPTTAAAATSENFTIDQGQLDDDGELPGERDVHRLGADAVHGDGDRCRWI